MTTRTITVEDDDGNEIDIELPLCWEICATCQGNEKHSRAVDDNGITGSEWAEWDQDEREAYKAGAYDRPCEDCRGSGKIQVTDYNKLDEQTLKLVEEKEQADAEYEALSRWERKHGY